MSWSFTIYSNYNVGMKAAPTKILAGPPIHEMDALQGEASLLIFPRPPPQEVPYPRMIRHCLERLFNIRLKVFPFEDSLPH